MKPGKYTAVAPATACLIDDDADVRHALRWLIESVQIDVREFGRVREFLESPRPDGPGCIVLDVRMPGMSGMEFLDHLATFKIDLPVIMLSGHGTVPMATRALCAGAVDFVEKPVNEQLLLDRVHEAVAKSRRIQAGKTRAERLSVLTDRELEIIRLVVEGGHNKDIARALGVSSRTVETHRAQAMHKLGARSAAELAAMLIEK